MSLFSELLEVAAGAFGRASSQILPLDRAADVPMQSIFDALEPRTYTLSELIDKGRQANLSYADIANWNGVKAPDGVSIMVRPADIEILQDGLADEGQMQTDKPLQAAGSQIVWQFNPYTTMSHVEATLYAVDGLTNMHNAVFYSAAQEDGRQVPMQIGHLEGVDVTGFEVRAPAEGEAARNVSLSFENANLENGTFQGIGNRLEASNSNVSGLNAEGSRAFAIALEQCTAQGIQLSGVSLAPDSRIENSVISGSFRESVLGNLSVAGSTLETPEMFAGTEISGMHFDGAKPRDMSVFEGAKHHGVVLSGETLEAFWNEKTANKTFDLGMKESPSQHDRIESPALTGTDNLLNALYQVHEAMGRGEVRRFGDVAKDNAPLESVALAEQNAIHAHRVTHDAGISHTLA